MKKEDGVLKEKQPETEKKNALFDLVFRTEEKESQPPQPKNDLLLYLKNILGYKITLLKDNTFMLTSIYAFTKDDYFCVEVKNSRMSFLSTPFLRQWKEHYVKYVTDGSSISAFLAAVNLELFNMKTSDFYNGTVQRRFGYDKEQGDGDY
ncbi:hypothetical protein ECANGB1_458 [Enterospora canceri]|uniref:Spindle assembly checkpoint component MAD1 n=1 Tax=Enterospora canceri TaxID=1081671 RepID=A0A1Y1S7Y8_9MICR|nr:hypothetical protein ECANGB1_458 [Enterospora canceri]